MQPGSVRLSSELNTLEDAVVDHSAWSVRGVNNQTGTPSAANLLCGLDRSGAMDTILSIGVFAGCEIVRTRSHAGGFWEGAL